MATKEQEKKALEKIKAIIDEVGGNDSYIGKAFEGCLEMAKDNIDNDFWNSPKECIRTARNNLQNEQTQVAYLKKELSLAKETCKQEAERANGWAEKYRGMEIANTANWNNFREKENEIEALQMEIIKLKARLFDMMEAQGA